MLANNETQFEISKDNDGQRLDKVLSTHPEIKTRSRAAKLIQMGNVKTKDGRAIKASTLVYEGEIFLLLIPQQSNSELTPYKFALDVVFEDNDLIKMKAV